MSFVHLHLHTHYSFLQGLGSPRDFVKLAKDLDMPALAITDSGNLHGSFEFYKTCVKEGIKPIIGLEAYISTKGFEYRGKDDHVYNIILLAKNNAGYKNLIQLVTKSYLHGFYYKPRIDFDLLEKHSEGLIALSACTMGEIPQHITTGKDDAFLLERIKWYTDLFGKEDFYLEIQEHPDRSNQLNINQKLIELAKTSGVKIVGTNDVHYTTGAKAEPQDLLSCLDHGRALDDPDRATLTEGNYGLRPMDEMKELFAYAPEAISSTMEIADKIELEIDYGKLLLPVYSLNEEEKKALSRYVDFVKDEKGLADLTDEEWLLRFLCYSGLNSRYEFDFDEETIFEYIKKVVVDRSDIDLATTSTEKLHELSSGSFTDKKKKHYDSLSEEQRVIIERLEYELLVVDLMGYNAYFIIVADFINWAIKNNIPVGPGRGSAAGAIIAYLSGITNIDPLKYGLLFERFLNPARVSMPDIDIDFSDEGRDHVIEYVREKYGDDHVAQICTFGTMAARAAVKDVGRAMGVPFQQMNDFAKLIPFRPGITIDEAMNESVELQQACDHDPRYAKIIANARELEGTARQLGVHACAVIIAPSEITDFCAIQHPPKDDQAIVTQLSQYPLEDLGLLKMDFLGLRNLTIIDRAIRIIKNHHGVDIDINKIDTEDPKVFEIFANGDTTGVFQFESTGMRRYLKDLIPNTFEDIIVMVSLYRPGPLQYIPTYIKRKHGKEKVKYPHDSLKEILEVTGGIAVYQEQIMQIVQTFAGFSLGEADILRRAMGKKIKSLMDEQKQKFIDAAIEQGHDKKLAEYIFTDIIEPFAGYGFNKSHAACYSMIAYQTAYLKAYYPTEFLTSLMVSDEEDMDRVILEVNEASSKGIQVLPPDINESRSHFTFIDKENIRFGLKAIKGLGDSPVRSIIDNREEEPYKDIVDFIERTGGEVINKKSLEALIMSGAMDGFGDRAQMLASVEKMSGYLKEIQKKQETNQMGLFDMSTNHDQDFSLEEAEPLSFEQKISFERDVIGIPVSGRPLQGLDRYIQMKSIGLEDVSSLLEKIQGYQEALDEGTDKKDLKVEKVNAQLVGYVTLVRKIQTKTGGMMVIAQCESSFFSFTLTVFPRDYERLSPLLSEGQLVWVRGMLDANFDMGELRLAASQIKSASISNIRAAAKKEGVFDQPMQEIEKKKQKTKQKKKENDASSVIPDSDPKSGSEDPETAPEGPEKDVSSQKDEAIAEYTIPIPAGSDREFLLKLKEFLGKQDKGETRIFIDLNGQKIDTKFSVRDLDKVKSFEAS